MDYQAFLDSFNEPIPDIVNYISDSEFEDEESLSDVSSNAEFTDDDEEQTGWDSNLIESYPEEQVLEVQVQLKECSKCHENKCLFKLWEAITVLKIKATLYRADFTERNNILLAMLFSGWRDVESPAKARKNTLLKRQSFTYRIKDRNLCAKAFMVATRITTEKLKQLQGRFKQKYTLPVGNHNNQFKKNRDQLQRER